MRKEQKSFQAETKELLNLMIHSIYTHKEIFLRELISNASDAIDKVKFKSLTDSEILKSGEEFQIKISSDAENKKLIIEDNGIGMSYDEVLENIGTIAKSGSKAFKDSLKESEKKGDTDIIGQFGVGFYSAFMVADEITLETKSPYSGKGVKWSSKGDGSYEIEEIEKEERGTKITLHIREEEEDEKYLQEYQLKSLVKKYSDYVKYPIMIGEERANSTKPIWKTSKNELNDEKYNEFYKSNFHDWEDPLHHMHLDIQGSLEYTALLYIPGKAPYDFYTRDFKRGLQLYTKNVFIMDRCEELIPEYLSFVKGLVQCDTLSLNISREILQKNSELSAIAKNLEKKIIGELEKTLKNDRDKYIKIWEAFGRNIKYGVQDMFGMNREKLQNLLLFKSSKKDEYVTLKEYTENMDGEQKEIYYVSGEDISILKTHPKVKSLLNKGLEVLFLTDKIDEFAIKSIMNYEEKSFKSVNDSDFKMPESEEDEKKTKELEENNKDLLEKMAKILKENVKEIKLSNSLGESAVAISTKGPVSLEMEKTLSEIPGNEGVRAEKVLELNPEHPIFKRLQSAEKDEEISDLADILYIQGMMIEGFPIKNPIEFVNKLNKYIR
ncbi:MAG: molecular chaperone HtpG [Fusobacteriaceae bacterium]